MEIRTREHGLDTRIRGEFREMPGLVLTLSQACRLWSIDRETCRTILERLEEAKFLRRTAKGAFALN